MKNKYLPNFISRAIAVTGFILATLYAVGTQAQTPQYAYSAGTSGGSNVFPLASTTNMVQWVYYPSHFTPTLPSTGLITTLYLYPSNAGSSTFTNLTIKMANTTATGTSSAWFTGLTTVYTNSSASLSWSLNTYLPISLQSSFFYTGGNLILEISETGYTSTGMYINQNYTAISNGREWGSVGSAAPSSFGTGQFMVGFDIAPAACSGTPTAGTITTAAMNPAAPVCAGGTFSLTGTDPNLGNGLAYSWQSSSSSAGPWSNVTSGTGATTLNYTTGPLPSTTWFRLGITCTNSSLTTYSAPYQVLVGAPIPSVISGSPTYCPGDVQTYSVTNVAGTTYSWTIPAGWTGSSTSNSITVTQGSSGGTISVTATSSCGTSIARTANIVAGSAPASPAAINGNTSVCASSTQTYTVAPVPGASSYVWTLPSGWTGSSTSNSITVITGSSAAPGTLQARAVNGCGSSTNTNLSINVITSITNPGPITSSVGSGTTYCTGMLYSFSIPAVPGATSYVWSLPTGWVGTVTGTSIQAFASSTPGSGQVKVTAYASCATSGQAVLTANVVTTVVPTVSVSSSAPTLCQGIASTFTATPVNGGTSPTYIWKKNGLVVPGTNNTYTDASLVNGDQISAVMVSNAQCRSADSIPSNTISANVIPLVTPGISINSVPVITTCEGTMLSLTTTTTGGGTAPTYQWYNNGVAIGGATNSSYNFSTANNKDTVTVQMTTTATCPKYPIATSNKVGILVNPIVNPTITVTASSTTPQQGVPITFTLTQSGGGATPVYQWVLNNVDIPGETGTTYTTSTLVSGDRVSVRMLSYDPCAKPGVVSSKEVILGDAAGVGSVGSWAGGVSLYPNPTGGRFTISAGWSGVHGEGRVKVEVYDMIGQRVYHSEAVAGKVQPGGQWHYEVDLGESMAAGQYMVRLSSEDGMNATLPLTVGR